MQGSQLSQMFLTGYLLKIDNGGMFYDVITLSGYPQQRLSSRLS